MLIVLVISYFPHNYVLTGKEIQLSFSDEFTFDLVKTPENIELLKETIKALSGHEMDLRLTLDTSNQDQDVPQALFHPHQKLH